MADLLVVGSVALDSVETPAGAVSEALGGSATYFACAASLFTPTRLVAAVGEDFPAAHRELLRARAIDLAGLETLPGRTFRWRGRYGADFDGATTLDTELNVFADFAPRLPEACRRAPYLFLANIAPELQASVLAQMAVRPRLVALDTMNYWIETRRSALERVMAAVDVVTLNEGEARLLTGESSVPRAARAIARLGPGTVVVKRGEHGALMLSGGRWSVVPAWPLERVVDPTGAGDSFAGGFMGYLAARGATGSAELRQALAHGAAVASFTVEGFSLDRLREVGPREIAERYAALAELVRLDEDARG